MILKGRPLVFWRSETVPKPVAVKAEELPPDIRVQLGLPARRSSFKQEDVRRWALKVLAVMGELSQKERARVLRHALKVNDV
jgi:hypothetical protein